VVDELKVWENQPESRVSKSAMRLEDVDEQRETGWMSEAELRGRSDRVRGWGTTGSTMTGGSSTDSDRVGVGALQASSLSLEARNRLDLRTGLGGGVSGRVGSAEGLARSREEGRWRNLESDGDGGVGWSLEGDGGVDVGGRDAKGTLGTHLVGFPRPYQLRLSRRPRPPHVARSLT
jgi:hypothetical protein